MCGRFTQRYTWNEVHAYLSLISPAVNLRPRYNVAPGQNVAAVHSDEDGCRLSMLRWGLIPSGAREPHIGYRLINARAETASTKPPFRGPYRARNCLIPADGFYEWTRRGAVVGPARRGEATVAGRIGERRAVRLRRMWERWTVREGAPLTGALAAFGPGSVIETCTILTTAANEIVAPVHDRMPVILPPEAFDHWLAGETVPLWPYLQDGMSLHPVSTLVNKPTNDDPRWVELIDDV